MIAPRTSCLKTDSAAVGTRTSEPEHAIPVSAHDRVVEITSLAEREAKPEDEDSAAGGAPPLVVEGEDESDPAAAEPAPDGEESPGIVNRVAEQVAGAAAKVLDLFT